MITQAQLLVAIGEAIEAHGTPGLNVRQWNALISAANDIIDALRSPDRPVIPGMGMNAWLQSDHTGNSSLYMARILAQRGAARYAFPHDPDDFNRCVGLLIACPELRQSLDSMAETGPEWAAIMPQWPEWERWLSEMGTAPEHEELYRRMRAVLEGV